LLSCRYFLQIKAENRRTGTVVEAKAAGKTPVRSAAHPGTEPALCQGDRLAHRCRRTL